MVSNFAVSFSNFLCFVLVSGECSAFALFRTVVKLIMLHYSCFATKNVQFQSLFCRLQNVFIIIRKKVIQHLRRTNKNGSPCIILSVKRSYAKACNQEGRDIHSMYSLLHSLIEMKRSI